MTDNKPIEIDEFDYDTPVGTKVSQRVVDIYTAIMETVIQTATYLQVNEYSEQQNQKKSRLFATFQKCADGWIWLGKHSSAKLWNNTI